MYLSYKRLSMNYLGDSMNPKLYEKLILLRDYFVEGYSEEIDVVDKYGDGEHNYVELVEVLPEIAKKFNLEYNKNRVDELIQELAGEIPDEQLQELFAKFKPIPSSLCRGNYNFYGRFYTYINGSGNLELKDSSELVRNNVKKAISELTEKGVQFLHTLVECYKKYNPRWGCRLERLYRTAVELGYSPSNPSAKTRAILQGYQILHKGGSNNYPEYVVPKEILPIIEEVLDTGGTGENGNHGILETIDRGALEVTDNIFDSIVGYEKYKRSMLRALRAEKPVHVLLVGAPASGKSLFMLQIAKYISGAEYYRGEHTMSKVGLIEFLIDKQPRILLIDEISKMDKSDRDMLLGVTDTGIVTVLKHGVHQKVQIDTRVWGATAEVHKLSKEFLSRFKVYRFRKYTEKEFIEVVTRYLPKEEHVDKEFAKYIAERLAPHSRDVRDAIKIARMCKTKEDVDEEIEIFFATDGEYSMW